MARRRGGWSWSRAAGEFAVIVLGVLAALAADAWNDARLDRIEETEYLSRLRSDLQRDTSMYRFVLDWMDRKEASLRRLEPVLKSSRVSVSDTATLVTDLANASNFGWNVGPLAGRATYEDLRSSGKLGLIQDPDLRTSVIEYYEHATGLERRIAARKTEFPRIAYRIVPMARRMEPGEFGASERAETEDVEALLAAVRASDLSSFVLAETNRALFIRNAIIDLRSDAVELLGRISEQLPDPGQPGQG